MLTLNGIVCHSIQSYVFTANVSKVPSVDEVTFVLEILDKIAGPALDRVELLLASPRWDNVGRNDFCR